MSSICNACNIQLTTTLCGVDVVTFNIKLHTWACAVIFVVVQGWIQEGGGGGLWFGG